MSTFDFCQQLKEELFLAIPFLSIIMKTAVSASLFYTLLFLAPARITVAQGNKTAAAAHLATEFKKADEAAF